MGPVCWPRSLREWLQLRTTSIYCGCIIFIVVHCSNRYKEQCVLQPHQDLIFIKWTYSNSRYLHKVETLIASLLRFYETFKIHKEICGLQEVSMYQETSKPCYWPFGASIDVSFETLLLTIQHLHQCISDTLSPYSRASQTKGHGSLKGACLQYVGSH